MKNIWIDNQKTFNEAMQHLQNCSVIVIDTEFYRRNSFFSTPCLLQIASKNTTYLIDLMVGIVLTEFSVIFQSKNIVKVIHASPEDIELLYRLTQVKPNALFDTQIAASLLNLGRQIGYAGLAKIFNEEIHIDKSYSMFDWRLRPLPQECIEYAAIDVLYLLPIYEQLKQQLLDAGKLSWVEYDSMQIANKVISSVTDDGELQYLDFHICANLDLKQQFTLAKLLSWREKRARHTNSLRKRVLADENILEFIIAAPKKIDKTKLARIFDSEKQRTKQLDSLWDIWLQIQETADTLGIIPILSKNRHNKLIASMGKKIQAVATENNVEAGYIASKKQVNSLIYYCRYDKNTQEKIAKPELLQGWRSEMVGQHLLEIYQNHTKT